MFQHLVMTNGFKSSLPSSGKNELPSGNQLHGKNMKITIQQSFNVKTHMLFHVSTLSNEVFSTWLCVKRLVSLALRSNMIHSASTDRMVTGCRTRRPFLEDKQPAEPSKVANSSRLFWARKMKNDSKNVGLYTWDYAPKIVVLKHHDFLLKAFIEGWFNILWILGVEKNTPKKGRFSSALEAPLHREEAKVHELGKIFGAGIGATPGKISTQNPPVWLVLLERP